MQSQQIANLAFCCYFFLLGHFVDFYPSFQDRALGAALPQ